MNEAQAVSSRPSIERTTFAVLFAVSFCHLLNDMMQALLPAIYPTLKTQFHLNFTEIGIITLAYQLTASLLQPVVGFSADKRPMPFSLPVGMVFTLVGLLGLSVAGGYGAILLCAASMGVGSSVFHPESSRVARMAAGGRYGLAQSLFQTGGNIGSALGPLTAAFVVLRWGQRSIAWYSLVALLAIFILSNVGVWYKTHGLTRMKSAAQAALANPRLSPRQVTSAVAILLVLIFSKYFYLASITSYYTFYLIHTFHLSVQSAQIHLFVFLAAVAVGTFLGGPLGDHFGRKYVIWLSILGALPFTLALPHANLFWTGVLSVAIGLIISSAFSAIVVYGQELMPGKVGMVAGLFFGFSFGMGGLGAAALGKLADLTDIAFVYGVCSFLPILGVLTAFLPQIETAGMKARAAKS